MLLILIVYFCFYFSSKRIFIRKGRRTDFDAYKQDNACNFDVAINNRNDIILVTTYIILSKKTLLRITF